MDQDTNYITMKKFLYYLTLVLISVGFLFLIASILSFISWSSGPFSYRLGRWCGTPYLILLAIGISLLFRGIVHSIIFKTNKKFKSKISYWIIAIAIAWGVWMHGVESLHIYAQNNLNDSHNTSIPVSSSPNCEKIKSDAETQYIEMCAQLNKQMPMIVDEITSIKCVNFYNWTFATYYAVDIDQDDWDSEDLKFFIDELQSKKREQIPSMIATGEYGFSQEDISQYLKGTGLKFRFVYHDKFDRQIGAIQFDYSDFE